MYYDLKLREALRKVGMDFFNKYYSRYSGEVANTKDPLKAGRVQLKVPSIYGDVIHEYWATPSGLPNGANEGMFWVPKVGTKVWVTFENGNCRFPVWSHGYWGSAEDGGNSILAGLYDDNGEPTKRQLTTSSGQTLLFDDTNKLVSITDVSGNKIQMDGSGISVVPKSGNKIFLGKLDAATYSSVLGEELKKIIKNILEGIENLTVMTMGGASSVPVNVVTFQDIVLTLDDMLSKMNRLE